MPQELGEIIQMALRTINKPKFEIYDSFGSSVTIDEPQCNFSLKDASTGTAVMANVVGTDSFLDVNNSDTDAAGNTIKTIQLTIDLHDTDITAGRYWLMLRVGLTNGETDRFKIQIDVIDFEDVGEAPVS